MTKDRMWMMLVLTLAFGGAIGCGGRDTPGEEAEEAVEEAGDEIEDATD